MPVVDLEEVFDGVADSVFDEVFGARFFIAQHSSEGHSDNICTEWGDDPVEAGVRRREAAYTLPDAVPVLRQGPTRVTVRETLRRDNGAYVVTSIANNKGGSLAEKTKVTATYTLRPANSSRFPGSPSRPRTAMRAHVVFTFDAPFGTGAVVAAAMAGEMRGGYGKLFSFARTWLRDRPPEPRRGHGCATPSMSRAASTAASIGGVSFSSALSSFDNDSPGHRQAVDRAIAVEPPPPRPPSRPPALCSPRYPPRSRDGSRIRDRSAGPMRDPEAPRGQDSPDCPPPTSPAINRFVSRGARRRWRWWLAAGITMFNVGLLLMQPSRTSADPHP